MKRIFILLIVLFFQLNVYGQAEQFSEILTSRYARIIGLGNSYTGLADDIESVYYNSAGLANLDYYGIVYSDGLGAALILDDYVANDIAIVIPTFKKIGIFAISRSHFSPDRI